MIVVGHMRLVELRRPRQSYRQLKKVLVRGLALGGCEWSGDMDDGDFSARCGVFCCVVLGCDFCDSSCLGGDDELGCDSGNGGGGDLGRGNE